MKRRELIKNSILGIGASALALSGCDKKEQTASSNNELNIIPKQTGVYQFSAPMLFSFKAIDEMASYNKEFKKSQIKTLYNSIPWPQSEKFNEWFMLCRGGRNPDIKTYSDFEKYVKYSFDKGFDVVYLMNSPKAFNDRDIEPFKKDFYKLLDNLWKTGIRKIKFSNTQVAQLIYEYNPNFKFQVATILEYSTVAQYQNLIHFFPNIKHICIPKDQNQNFKLLTSLKKAFPKIELEIMIDEGCLKFCPSRFSCMASSYTSQYKIGCTLSKGYAGIKRTLDGAIKPWEFEYYSAIGINNFKTVPFKYRASDTNTEEIKEFLKAVEGGIEDKESMQIYLKNFRGIETDNPKEIISLFPKMEYFIKHGHECATKCGVDCNYCIDCARKLESKLLYG